MKLSWKDTRGMGLIIIAWSDHDEFSKENGHGEYSKVLNKHIGLNKHTDGWFGKMNKIAAPVRFRSLFLQDFQSTLTVVLRLS